MTDKRSVKIDKVLQELNKEKINTWFDLGLFIDRFKEKKLKSAFQGDPGGKRGCCLCYILFYHRWNHC